MLHAANGDCMFDGSISWQKTNNDSQILRKPRKDLPDIGISCKDISLVNTEGCANAEYVVKPVGIKVPPWSPGETLGTYDDLNIRGFLDLLTVKPEQHSA
jgi:hypothetical protein